MEVGHRPSHSPITPLTPPESISNQLHHTEVTEVIMLIEVTREEVVPKFIAIVP